MTLAILRCEFCKTESQVDLDLSEKIEAIECLVCGCHDEFTILGYFIEGEVSNESSINPDALGVSMRQGNQDNRE
jgi:Zn ribbon nucleic-acid-binding protein